MVPSERRLRNPALTGSRRREPWHIGSSIIDFCISHSVLRSRVYVLAIALGLAPLREGYFVPQTLFLRAIAVNLEYVLAIVLSGACLLFK
jgi:hypothetical protein